MYSPRRKDWARALLSALDLPVSILPAVTQPGTVLAPVHAEVAEECGFTQPFSAIAVGSHDTASAVAAIPNMDEESVFLSSGTWSLMGVEAAEPNTSEEALRLGFTNEGGADGAVLLLKNITGLWIVQECMRHWASEGRNIAVERIGFGGRGRKGLSVLHRSRCARISGAVRYAARDSPILRGKRASGAGDSGRDSALRI